MYNPLLAAALVGLCATVAAETYCPGCSGAGCSKTDYCDDAYGCERAAKSCVKKCDPVKDCFGGDPIWISDSFTCACKTCGEGYTGVLPGKCDKCTEGYEMEGGKCVLVCTPTKACNSHAESSKYNSGKKRCDCVCSDKWDGLTCDSCPSAYGGSNCNQCGEGAIGYPNCKKCTVDAHCNGNAEGVTAKSGKCNCDCKVGYEGADCGTCASGRTNYPRCEPCTVSGVCSGHASKATVSADKSTCTCTCTNQWEGASCDSCPSKFEGDACNTCKGNRITYPTCTSCTSSAHCSGHAKTVVANPQKSGCVCTCKDKWEGAKCDSCPSKYEQGSCSSCKKGSINYPTCTTCTVAKDCSGRGSAVTSDSGNNKCVCTCSNHWSGNDCSVCKAPWGGSNCDGCAGGYTGATCSPICTNAGKCNGRASKVSWVKGTECACTCKAGWEGSDCGSCPSSYDQSSCDKCKADYFGKIPSCTRCTVAAHCNGRATSVTSSGDRSKCVCSGCNGNWGGSNCGSCPSPYTGSSCDTCRDGYSGYPNCGAICTNAKSCNGRAKSVKWLSGTNCECTCKDQWGGATCNTCNAKYDQATCKACAGNLASYPTCEACDNAKHCSNHAESVKAVNNVCQCTCRNKWTGASCNKCNAPFGGANCNECLPGNNGYPNCAAKCTVASSCKDRASKVVYVASSDTCECTCKNKWTGASCATCPKQFGGSDCETCSPGYINYPACTACDASVACGGNAQSVTSKPPFTKCECACSNQFTGNKCDTCSSPFTGSACDQCLPKFKNYPACGDKCTKADQCSGHAESVSYVKGDGTKDGDCACTCSNKWSGSNCGTCPSQYGGADCNKCAAAHVNYPTCTACSVDTHCSSHAASVESDAAMKKCVCTCSNKWSGADCSTCDSAKYAGAECNMCAPGLMGYPDCTPACTAAKNCTSHSTEVVFVAPWACKCTCADKFGGAACDQCDAKYKQDTCDACAFGLKDFPTCGPICTLADCNGHGESVKYEKKAGQGLCQCSCKNQWSSPEAANGGRQACSACAANFDSGADCAACSEGHIGYPTCTKCTVSEHCSGHATETSSNAAKTACGCKCIGFWEGADCGVCPASHTGDNCNQCAAGYAPMMDGNSGCFKCSVDAHCNGHGVSVETMPKGGCKCKCKNGWIGDACEICPAKYTGTECNVCRNERGSFPDCGVPCVLTSDCHGNGVSVEKNVQSKMCDCKCRNKFSAYVKLTQFVPQA